MSQSVIYMMISKHKIICKVFKGLCIVYFVTHWVRLASVNSKCIHQSKQKPIVFGAELTFAAANFLHASLMLDNPFLVPSFCKLNHINLCFI